MSLISPGLNDARCFFPNAELATIDGGPGPQVGQTDNGDALGYAPSEEARHGGRALRPAYANSLEC